MGGGIASESLRQRQRMRQGLAEAGNAGAERASMQRQQRAEVEEQR